VDHDDQVDGGRVDLRAPDGGGLRLAVAALDGDAGPGFGVGGEVGAGMAARLPRERIEDRNDTPRGLCLRSPASCMIRGDSGNHFRAGGWLA
jgi:hypothetical protein